MFFFLRHHSRLRYILILTFVSQPDFLFERDALVTLLVCYCPALTRDPQVVGLNSCVPTGYDGQISLQKRSELPYTCAVIEELFRFRTLSPLSIVHATTENAVLGKYFIPKNTPVSKKYWYLKNMAR